MVVATNDVDEVVFVVCSNCEVLPWYIHFPWGEHHFALIVNHETPVRSEGCVALKPTHEEELVIWDVDRLEIMWDVICCVVLIILQGQFLKLTSLLDVVKRAQLMSVEGDQRHREVRVVCHFADLINQVDFILEAVEVGEFEF